MFFAVPVILSTSDALMSARHCNLNLGAVCGVESSNDFDPANDRLLRLRKMPEHNVKGAEKQRH